MQEESCLAESLWGLPARGNFLAGLLIKRHAREDMLRLPLV